jgi:hypothetical protein
MPVAAAASPNAPITGRADLKLFWNPARGDNATCGTDICAYDQTVSGYTFIRIECYVYP